MSTSGKPQYRGSYEEYYRLPREVKQYYSPPPPSTEPAPSTHYWDRPLKPLTKDQPQTINEIQQQQQAEAYFRQETPEGYELVSTKKVPSQMATPLQRRMGKDSSGKPQYRGSYEEYYRLPREVKQYYSPPPYYMATYKPIPPPKSIAEQIAGLSPVRLAAGFWEFFGKEISEEDVQALEKYMGQEQISWTYGTTLLPSTKGAKEVLGGVTAAFESPVYTVGTLLGVKNLPRPPTALGAVTSSAVASVTGGKLTESAEWKEAEKTTTAYLAGSIMGDVALSYLIGKGAGKLYKIVVPESAQRALSSTKYSVTQSIKQSRVGIATSKFLQRVKFTEPIYTIRKIPERISTWSAKRSSTALENLISWEPDIVPVMTGFERAFPSDIIYTAGAYKTYGGFELWATVREAHKYAGYPVLRPLGASVSLYLRKGTETWLFEGTQVIPQQEPYVAKELGTWETWSSAAEAHPYAGYPVTYGRVTGVTLTTKPTAFEQIMKGIERGMFAKYGGGLSATQIPVYAKPTYDVTEMLKQPRTYGKKGSFYSTHPIYEQAITKKVSSNAAQLLAITAGTKVTSILETPQRLKPKTETFRGVTEKFDWEAEKLKYKTPDVLSTKEKNLLIPVPKVTPIQQPKTVSIPTLKIPTPSIPDITIPEPKIPPFTPPSPKVPDYPPLLLSRRGGGHAESKGISRLFGIWIPRKHKVKTWQQQIETFGLGSEKTKKKQKRKKRRKSKR